jgi:hypothetical protein
LDITKKINKRKIIMKKLFILLTICIGIAANSNAQVIDSTGFYNMFSVNTATNSVVATPAPQPGLNPTDTFLRPAVRGVAVLDTIVFTNYDSVTAPTVGRVQLNWLKVDSLYLPSGLSWSTNNSTNTFAGGAAGAILVQGTTYDTAGQYKIRLIVHVNVQVPFLGAVTQGPYDAESQTGLAYRVRVKNCGCATPFIDNSPADSVRVFIPYSCDSTTGGSCINSINEISNDISNVSVVPNPFSSSANLMFNSSIEGTYTVRMTNLIGAVVSSEEKNIVHGSNDITIERNGLSSGIYLLSISNGSSSIIRKVIIE